MCKTICWYPKSFLTLVPAPVIFVCHEKESTSSEVTVQCILPAMAAQNSAHDRRVWSSHGLCWLYDSFAFFPDVFLGISVKRPYVTVWPLEGALCCPFRLRETSGDGEQEETGDGEQGVRFNVVTNQRCYFRGGLHWGDIGGELDPTSMIAAGPGMGGEGCGLW